MPTRHILKNTHVHEHTHTHTNTMFEEQFTISHVSMGGPADLDQILIASMGSCGPWQGGQSLVDLYQPWLGQCASLLCDFFSSCICFKLIAVLLAKVSQRIQPRASVGGHCPRARTQGGIKKKNVATNVISLPSASQLKGQLQILGEVRQT